MRIIWNTTEDEHLAELLKLLPGAQKFECAVAFVKQSGFGNLKKDLLSRMRAGMSARMIIGLDFYLTDPEVLNDLLEWKNIYKDIKLEVYTSVSYPPYCFHPKIYLFHYQKYTHAVIGSANLTAGGIGGNWECSVSTQLLKRKELTKYIDGLIAAKYVIELKDEDLIDYWRRHRLSRTIRAASQLRLDRLLEQPDAPNAALEALEEFLRALKSDPSPRGFEAQRQEREAAVQTARLVMADIRENPGPTSEELEVQLYALRARFHSGMIQMFIPAIARSVEELPQLLTLASEAADQGLSPGDAYASLRPLSNSITGLGPNWVSEILHALNPTKYAICNKNSAAGLAMAGYECPARPTKSNVTAAIYGKFCADAVRVQKGLGLENLSELDLLFSHAYFNS